MMAKLTLLEEEWTRQPSTPPPLAGRFAGSQKGFCFLPSLGFFTTEGAETSFVTTNPSFSGPRFGSDIGGRFIRLYADHGGNTDDRLQAPSIMPTAKSVAMTTILTVRLITTGEIQTILPARDGYGAGASGHFIELRPDNFLAIGYEGGNGYARLSSSFDGAALLSAPQTIVISTVPGQDVNAAMSGLLVTSYTGLASYIGQGLLAESSRPTTGGYSYFEYYHLNGQIYLWAQFPGVFLSAHDVVSVSKNPWQIFEPEQIHLFKQVVTAQFSRPVSDVSAGGWTASTGSDLYAMLDEAAADDGDYITTTSASVCEVALGSLSDPALSTGHIVRYRISATGGGIIVRLREGSTTIASWTHNPAPGSPTTYAQTLSGGEADSITSYSALKLQFEAIA